MWITGAVLFVGSFLVGAVIARIGYSAGRASVHREIIKRTERRLDEAEERIRLRTKGSYTDGGLT